MLKIATTWSLCLALVVLSTVAGAQTSTEQTATAVSGAQSMDGKIFVGYQGWFAPQDGSGKWVWFHYGRGGKFEPGNCSIDMWPDVSDLGADERVPTAFRHADGSVAEVFNPENPKTVERHFAWMKEYGIDGAFLQRFAVDLSYAAPHMQKVMANVRQAAGQSGRSWAVMYDLSGLRQGQMADRVTGDWKSLVRDQKILADPAYLHHHGKPVVAVWGVGFNDHRQYTLQECLELVRFLKHDPVYGGNMVMLGVPYWWRELRRDALDDALLHQIIGEADIISPWSVGRLSTPADADARQRTVLEPDLAWLQAKGLDYLPVIFPGYSFHNASGGKSKFDQIPRQGGAFLWAQAVAARKAGAKMAYVAMFDEVNEGTAILKVSNDPPVGESPFVTYAGLPSDHYLWLTGQIGRLLQGQIHPTAELPSRDMRK
jgi:hypothetical protein